MNGYLMREKTLVKGSVSFVESMSGESDYGVAFEDDGATGYFYALQKDPGTGEQQILDALHIYQMEESDKRPSATVRLLIIWSKDWQKAALVLDGCCHALFDFSSHGAYNLSGFPPPGTSWTRQGRLLTKELLKNLF